MRLVGSAHPAIRATHRKTLELAHDIDITERATCVAAVGLRPSITPVAGDVLITLRAGTASFTFQARGNSGWDPSGTAIIRRSPFRYADTFATHASAAAADLPRSLVTALADPVNSVEAEIESVRGRRCAVLFALDAAGPPDARLGAELAAADVVVAEDVDAARLLGVRVAHGPVPVDGRVLVVACRELPGQTVTDALTDVDVETVGLTPGLAAAAASPSRAPVLFATDAVDTRQFLTDAPTRARVVVPAAADDLRALVALAARLRGTAGAVATQGSAPPVRIGAEGPFELASRDPVHVCFDAAPQNSALDPRVRAAIDGLLADGVPTKAAAKALAALSGWDRRRAYDAVLSWPDSPDARAR